IGDRSLALEVHSDMPPGASTGTSAALIVAVVSALMALRGERVGPDAIARAAHRLETKQLRLESGIQDQIAAAYGGINFIEIGAYPAANVTSLTISDEVSRRLQDQLVLVYLGRAHLSSHVHEAVIAGLHAGGSPRHALDDLRAAASAARDALIAGDL